jgi:hypothetical protein
MTSRARRFLTSLSLLTLTPLLAAPRCHFGEGKLHLGEDATAGEGGADGEGGTSGSPTGGTGASATGGKVGNGGSSGTGTGGGVTGGGSSGGAGGTGGTGPVAGPCLETLLPLTWEDTHGLEFDEEDVRRLLAGEHHGPLAWSRGPATLTLALVGVRVFYVESEPNPDYPLDIVVSCENHVRAVAIGRVWTSNGEIDATIPDFKLNITIPTLDGPGPAADRLEAAGVATIAAENMGGDYGTQIDSIHCFHSLQLNIGIGRDEFNGEILETLELGPCDDPSGAVTGQQAGSWRCPGDCRTTAQPNIVVEAESCEGIGEQVTSGDDGESFTRTGDTLTRSELWGCGCPDFPEYTMAWSRRSPLELRLCHDEDADRCEGICEEELSHDLSTAFRSAGASDYRFED